MDQETASHSPGAEALRSPPPSNSPWSKKSDLAQFRRALFSGTPRLVVTPLLVVACAAMYLTMVVSGVPFLRPAGTDLILWGANEGSRIILRHQHWRLVSMMFVHGGLIHLVVNMWSLAVIGPFVERLYGSLAFAVIYLAAGVGGALASVAASPARVSVGASGAICGVLGALVAFLLVHRRSIPAAVGTPLVLNLVGIVVFMAVLGFVVPNIDHEAHVGGLVTGFVCGLLLTSPWPVKRGHRAVGRRLMASVAIVLALAGTEAAVTRRGERALPPLRRYQDLAEQLTPAIAEYDSIVEGMPGTLVLSRDRDEPPVRAKHARLLSSLIERARANVVRLRSASTPDPALRVMIGDLVKAQSCQIESLQAALAYLETGKRDLLQGERGVLDRRVAANREIQAFHEHKNKYLNERVAAPAPAAPKAVAAQGRSS